MASSVSYQRYDIHGDTRWPDSKYLSYTSVVYIVLMMKSISNSYLSAVSMCLDPTSENMDAVESVDIYDGIDINFILLWSWFRLSKSQQSTAHPVFLISESSLFAPCKDVIHLITVQ